MAQRLQPRRLSERSRLAADFMGEGGAVAQHNATLVRGAKSAWESGSLSKCRRPTFWEGCFRSESIVSRFTAFWRGRYAFAAFRVRRLAEFPEPRFGLVSDWPSVQLAGGHFFAVTFEAVLRLVRFRRSLL